LCIARFNIKSLKDIFLCVMSFNAYNVISKLYWKRESVFSGKTPKGIEADEQ
jgi:hypothetical protein